jgi:hypothetical protein
VSLNSGDDRTKSLQPHDSSSDTITTVDVILKHSIVEMKHGIVEMKHGIVEMKHGIVGMKHGIVGMKHGIVGMKLRWAAADRTDLLRVCLHATQSRTRRQISSNLPLYTCRFYRR